LKRSEVFVVVKLNFRFNPNVESSEEIDLGNLKVEVKFLNLQQT
jgi:hypothetical protein